jgi:hypothetical protein
MAKNEALTSRARGIIEANPTYGKNKVNAILKSEFGVGLRDDTLLQIKREVAFDNPKLIPDLYRTGGVPKGKLAIYQGYRESGFLPFEARELTIGHGKDFNSQEVYDSIPAQQARAFRKHIIEEQIKLGWTKEQIKDNISDFYKRGKNSSVWEHIRAEYKPRKKVDFVDYREDIRRRAKAKQNRLLKGY